MFQLLYSSLQQWYKVKVSVIHVHVKKGFTTSDLINITLCVQITTCIIVNNY